MERLTVHTRYGYQIKGLSPLAHDYDLRELKVIGDAASRLAKYEATELCSDEIKTLKAEKEVYKKHWLDLCDKIIAEIDKDGWYRLVMTRDEVVKMKALFEGTAISE